MKAKTKTVQGAFWTIYFSGANKIATLLGQLALAWILIPSDFGVVVIAQCAVAFFNLFSAGSLSDFLVQRQKTFRRDAAKVFWLGLSVATVSMLLLVVLAKPIEKKFGHIGVESLIYWSALLIPLASISTVYFSKLRIQLKFKEFARIQFWQGFTQTILSVLFAWLGFGPKSLILPIYFSMGVGIVGARYLTGKIDLSWPNLKTWNPILKGTLWVSLANFFQSLFPIAPSFFVGLSFDATQTGYFSWGNNVATQAIFLVALNLRGLLVPSFTKLKNTKEPDANFAHRIATLLTLGIVVTCIFQYAMARPLIEFMFKGRWNNAIPVIEWVTMGLSLQGMFVVGQATLTAEGRFRTLFFVNLIAVALTCICSALGATHTNASGASVGLAIGLVISALLSSFIANGGSMMGLYALKGPMTLAITGTIAILASFLLNSIIGIENAIFRALIQMLAGGIFLIAILKLFMHEAWNDLAKVAIILTKRTQSRTT